MGSLEDEVARAVLPPFRCRRYDSQPVGRVITEINPILRGWVNYFRIGNAARCLAYVMNWRVRYGARA